MNKKDLAYIIGVAMGDGNLSNPNGRATRLRITCDLRYKNLISNIILTIQRLLPQNKVSVINRKNCLDISCYSNKWEGILGWRVGDGSKEAQKISIPNWIKNNKNYTLRCLKGLFETDGSIYFDRKYKMANFTTIIPTLAEDVMSMIEKIGFKPNMQKLKTENNKIKYTIRVSKDIENFIELVGIDKS